MNCRQLTCLLGAVLILALSSVDGKKFKPRKSYKNFKNAGRSAREKYREHLKHPVNLVVTTAGLAYSSVLLEEYLQETKVIVPKYKDLEPHMQVIRNMTIRVGQHLVELPKKKEFTTPQSIIFCVLSILLMLWSIYDYARDYQLTRIR